jgi:3-hydroxyisobutyrate dehydrogenase-like beta-hydroxyacid dehydrogenase
MIVGNPATIAILGLGEAGSAIAADLVAAGCEVPGWDPVPKPVDSGVRLASGALDAVAGAEIVLSVNLASVAVEVAREVAPALAPGAIYADLNTAYPRLKREAAAPVEASGHGFVDVALMAPVPGRGLSTPALASGSGAGAFVVTMAPLGMPVQALGERAGEAAERKLLRSIFAKGLAAAALEALAAARAAGCEQWLHEHLVETLDGADGELLDRLVQGSRTHAVRRGEEMRAASAMSADLGTPSRISDATVGWLEQLSREGGRRDG